MNGLELWEKVEKTDPKHTKAYSGRGGFKGTAIKPIYLIKKATELWGPIGGRWGARVVEEKIHEGCPMLAPTGVVGYEKLHSVLIELRYPITESDTEGLAVVQAYGHTLMVGTNKNGPFTDDEAPKKSFTDAIGKALHYLGFSADVYFGEFDGSKYADQQPASKAPEVLEEDLEKKLTDSIKQAVDGKEIEDRIAALAVADTKKGMDILKEIEKMPHAAPREKRKALLREKVKNLGWNVDKVNDEVIFSAPDPLNAA